MIKRVIFDIDDTLIPWKYSKEVDNVLNDLGIKHTEEDTHNIIKALEEYENEYYMFDKKLMIQYINKYTKKQYPETFIYTIIDRWAECVPSEIDSSIQDTLKYLNKKYEIVALTDWFVEPQSKRLEKVGILKYFSNIYGAEKTKRKPFKDAFTQAIKTNKLEECIMIGNSIERDIKGALNAGLQAIWYNPNNKLQNIEYEKNQKYQIITKIEQLQEIL